MNEFVGWLTLVVPFTIAHTITFAFKPTVPTSVGDETVAQLPLITLIESEFDEDSDRYRFWADFQFQVETLCMMIEFEITFP